MSFDPAFQPRENAVSLPSLYDQKVFVIECRTRGTREAWEQPMPDRRYSLEEVREFQADLTFEDTFCTVWRARAAAGFAESLSGSDGECVLPMHYMGIVEDDANPVVHRHTRMEGDERLPPTGWAGVLHQLGLKED